MLRKIFILFPILLMLTGCIENRQKQLNRMYTMCMQYGFRPGTDTFAQCMQKQDMQEQIENEQHYQRMHEQNLVNSQMQALTNVLSNKHKK